MMHSPWVPCTLTNGETLDAGLSDLEDWLLNVDDWAQLHPRGHHQPHLLAHGQREAHQAGHQVPGMHYTRGTTKSLGSSPLSASA